jgi:predicted transcriptional regulator of viral defense system
MARLSELKRAGATSAAVSRLEREGAIVRLARGLYQLPDAPLDTHHTLAESAKLAPRAVICLGSALTFHDLTDRIPAQTWMAIGPKDWRPTFSSPSVRFVRFPPRLLTSGVETHAIEGVAVRIYSPAKTIADLFRYRRSVGLDVAVGGLKEAHRRGRATQAEIARYAVEGRVWKVVQPYVEALTINA